MTLADEDDARKIRDGLIKAKFYVCGVCDAIDESYTLTDKCPSCGWEGEHDAASTREGAERIAAEHQQPGYNRLLGRMNPPQNDDTERQRRIEIGRTELQEGLREVEEKLLAKRVLSEVKDLRTLIENGIPEVEYLARPVIPKRSIVVIGASAGSFKTYLAIQLALSVASGKPFLEHFETTKGHVLYLDEENGVATLLRRFTQLADGHEIEEIPENIKLLSFSGLKLDDSRYITALLALIDEYNVELFVLDSMVRLMDGEEDKSSDVRRVFDTLKDPLETRGVTFLVLHHTRKDDDGRMSSLRGSGDFSAFADVVLMVRKQDSNRVMIRIDKHRHIDLSDVKPFFFSVEHPGGDMEKVRLVHSGIADHTPAETVADKCAAFLEKWLLADMVERFDGASAYSRAKKSGFSKRAYYGSLEQLRSRGIIHGGNKTTPWTVDRTRLLDENTDSIPAGKTNAGIAGKGSPLNEIGGENNLVSNKVFPSRSLGEGTAGIAKHQPKDGATSTPDSLAVTFDTIQPGPWIKNSRDILTFLKLRGTATPEDIVEQAMVPVEAIEKAICLLARNGDVFEDPHAKGTWRLLT